MAFIHSVLEGATAGAQVETLVSTGDNTVAIALDAR